MISKIKCFSLISVSLFSLNVFAAEIKPCNTSECASYFKEYKKFAKSGYADAMSTLSELYRQGYGTEKNMKQAVRFLKLGAKYGSVSAQF